MCIWRTLLVYGTDRVYIKIVTNLNIYGVEVTSEEKGWKST